MKAEKGKERSFSGVRLWIHERFPVYEFLDRHFIGHMTPANLNYMWNFGSLAAFFFVIQIVTGIFLAMYYKPDPDLAFQSVQHITHNVNYGWLIRSLHVVGASGFIIAVFLHIGRGIYYGSYKAPREVLWGIGVLILLVLMMQTFTGYTLPWGQMSFWAANVSTSFFSAIPAVGDRLVVWLRGDYGVGDATLTRFYSLHTTVLPIAVLGGLVFLHMIALHRVGSNNPDGADETAMIPFHPYYTWRDLFFISAAATVFFYFVFFQPDFFSEPLNYEKADPFKTPTNIVPEWYFLPSFAMLKAIPNKLLGLVAANGAVILLLFLPFIDRSPLRSARQRPIKRALTIIFFINFIMLGYAGSFPPEGAPLILGRIGTAVYFLYFAALAALPEGARPQAREEAPA